MNQETGDSILTGIQILNLHGARVESLLYVQNLLLRLILCALIALGIPLWFMLKKRFSNGV